MIEEITLEAEVLIIGAGVTGVGLARDLALRGVHCVVVEAKDINGGASGANNGLLHSGARYVSNDPVSAEECRDESRLLKTLAPACIEDTGGLFVAVAGDDEAYIAEFPRLCARHGIPVRELQRQEALELEPALADSLIAAYLVEDAAINPFRLSLENITQAEAHGSRLMTHTAVVRFEREGSRIQAAHLRQKSGRETVIEAQQVVNATGPWAGTVAALAGLSVPIIYSKGTLLVTQTRVARSVINRLRPPSDGDIVSPGGTVSLVGTTSVGLNAPSPCRPTLAEVDRLVTEAAVMVPMLADMRYVRAFAGVRPLLPAKKVADTRALSRGFVVLDHEAEGLSNFITITGGKITTFRLMAEKAADLICSRLGVTAVCLTRTLPLPSTEINQWSEPGLAPRIWLKKPNPKEPLLCECEMVPLGAVEQIIDSLIARGETIDLSAIGLRSRFGRGSCQGAFCGFRMIAHLYQRGELESDQGLSLLRQFLERRWHGLRPILWGPQLAQEELQEALHCGLFGLEMKP
jgi:glycerol-3-phosphate dehydrogenase